MNRSTAGTGNHLCGSIWHANAIQTTTNDQPKDVTATSAFHQYVPALLERPLESILLEQHRQVLQRLRRPVSHEQAKMNAARAIIVGNVFILKSDQGTIPFQRVRIQPSKFRVSDFVVGATHPLRGIGAKCRKLAACFTDDRKHWLALHIEIRMTRYLDLKDGHQLFF